MYLIYGKCVCYLWVNVFVISGTVISGRCSCYIWFMWLLFMVCMFVVYVKCACYFWK